MLKVLVASVSLLLIIGVSFSQETKQQTIDWQPIIQAATPGKKSFINRNSFSTTDFDDGKKFNSADVMISFNPPLKINLGGKELNIGSIVKTVLIECDSAIVSPVQDLYFTEAIPTERSLSLGGRDYTVESVSQTSFRISKKLAMYSALCPIYI